MAKMKTYNLIMRNGYKSVSAEITAEDTEEAIFKSAGIIPHKMVRTKTAELYLVNGTDARNIARFDGLKWWY